MPASRVALIAFALLCFFGCTAFGPPVMTDADIPHHRLTGHQIHEMYDVPQPQVTAEAALLVNLDTGEILYSLNPRKPHAPASLTKMVTAMVALQRGKLDQKMRIQQYDAQVYSAAGLDNGEPLSMEELLHFLLIPSDNVAARAIARELGGRVKTYVGWMNEWVAERGLTDTHFGNPSGLDNDENITTAIDLAIIAREAIKNPVFADIVSTSETYVAGHWIQSTNELLPVYPGMIGVKTGTTDLAGECLVTIVKQDRGDSLTVVLGSEDRFRDTRVLLDYAYANFAQLRIDLPDSAVNQYRDAEGNWHSLTLAEPVHILVSPWQLEGVQLFRRIDDLLPNPDPDQPVGVLQISLSGEPTEEVALYARP